MAKSARSLDDVVLGWDACRLELAVERRRHIEAGNALRRLIEAEGERYPDLFASWREEGAGKGWELIGAHLAALHHAGLLDIADPTLAARQFVALSYADIEMITLFGGVPTEADLRMAARSAVRTFLREYNAKYGATILLTSHYMADITALCKRVLLIHQGTLFYDGALAGIIDRFAPYREVKLAFAEEVPRDRLEGFGEVEAAEGRSACFVVRREALTATVEKMMATLPVEDLTVTEPPIEGIIGELFAQGAVK